MSSRLFEVGVKLFIGICFAFTLAFALITITNMIGVKAWNLTLYNGKQITIHGVCYQTQRDIVNCNGNIYRVISAEAVR